jgi:hypothetical protein
MHTRQGQKQLFELDIRFSFEYQTGLADLHPQLFGGCWHTDEIKIEQN